ncbi:LysR family transcriptional regulator [Ferrimonas lipolytica]|uniref:LysR family transcriptional regulator n=1 Tax=Ferrimonas lipolytica TaxID=2724191 RepID=A0A6H1UA29_9GAMM|nr:LysR family transcriptional regulator [Ferrimonas lipolytica]QIZ75907.1 LysR family transcriptional regulator [Ferrimonas lipolytica]
MDLRRLRCFVAVFEERNMTVAAQRCFVSQPSLSSSIKQLEEELGAILFTRHKRGVDLTDDAHQLYPLARRLLGQADELPAMFAERQDKIKLRLANFHDLSPSELVKFIARCQAAEPRLQIELCDHDDNDTDARLTLDVLKRDEELFLPLWEEDYQLCVPVEHELAQLEQVPLAQLDQYSFIECAACEAHQQTLSLLASGGFAVNLVAKAAHKTQVRHMVCAGLGISFLPSGVLEGCAQLKAVPLMAPRMFRRIGLCIPASAADSNLSQLLRNAASS